MKGILVPIVDKWVDGKMIAVSGYVSAQSKKYIDGFIYDGRNYTAIFVPSIYRISIGMEKVRVKVRSEKDKENFIRAAETVIAALCSEESLQDIKDRSKKYNVIFEMEKLADGFGEIKPFIRTNSNGEFEKYVFIEAKVYSSDLKTTIESSITLPLDDFVQVIALFKLTTPQSISAAVLDTIIIRKLYGIGAI